MIGLYAHATGCFVRDSAEPDLIASFPFYSTEHCIGYLSWRYTIWPGILYFGERMYREIRARRATRLSKVLVHPSGAMELRIVKPSFKYVAGQWLFIKVPAVSGWQWHPVSAWNPSSFSIDCLYPYSSPSPRLRRTRTSLSTFVKSVTGLVVLAMLSVLAPQSCSLLPRPPWPPPTRMRSTSALRVVTLLRLTARRPCLRS
jgi:hypothetical protein